MKRFCCVIIFMATLIIPHAHGENGDEKNIWIEYARQDIGWIHESIKITITSNGMLYYSETPDPYNANEKYKEIKTQKQLTREQIDKIKSAISKLDLSFTSESECDDCPYQCLTLIINGSKKVVSGSGIEWPKEYKELIGLMFNNAEQINS